MANSESNMEMEEEEEVQVPDDQESNIELGSAQGSEGGKSDGEINEFYLKISGFYFLTGFNELTVRNISDLRRSLKYIKNFFYKNYKMGITGLGCEHSWL